jgi:hypothetical protein
MFYVSFTIMCICDEVVNRCQLYQVDLWCRQIQVCPYWFSASWLYLFISDRGVLMSPTIIVNLLLLPAVLSVLPHIFWCSVIRHINLKDCWILGELSLYWYVILLFIPDNIPSSEVCSLWSHMAAPAFFLSVWMTYLFSSLYFYVYSYLK